MKKEAAGGGPPLNNETVTRTVKMRVVIAVAIFLLAISVRVLTWHDTRLEVGKVQTQVSADYWRIAGLLEHEGVRGFFSSSSGLADPGNLGHPPGYSILIASIQSGFRSESAIQFLQIVFDAAAAVVIFLLVAECFSLTAAALAGLFAALSPQLAWNSVLLLPDSLAVFPILFGVYLLARTRRSPRLILFVVAGALIGLSCWLRANAMLLTVFLAAAVLLLQGRKKWRYSLAVICGTLVIILPLTIRNAVVFHRFIPLSLGAGQTFLEGIADYDPQGRLGIPNTDMGIMKQEAEMFQRPDYYGTLFRPDGVERERWRIRRGLSVIGSHPLWFSSVMLRRAASMLKLERTARVSPRPAVTHLLSPDAQPLYTKSAGEMFNDCRALSAGTKFFLDQSNSPVLTIVGDDSKYSLQVSCGLSQTNSRTDYVVAIPVKTEQGRMRISVTDGNGANYSSAILEPVEGKSPQDQPINSVELPFVSTSDQIRVEFRNEAPNVAHSFVHVESLRLYELGPARFLWTSYPRIVLHAIQRLFLTAVFLPLALVGLGVTIFQKQTAALVILAVVPFYYFCVQSAFHTEYRYVLAVNYFLFAFAAVAVAAIIRWIKVGIASWRGPALSTD